MTWLDHSILTHLVLVSQCEIAAELLQQFESLIDYTQPITSYPIPAPSQLMIPLDDSDYTLVATICDYCLEEETLQRIVDIKGLLVEKWEITDHALQLMAMHITQRILYWMIPKCVASMVEDKINDNAHYDHELCQIMTVFPLSDRFNDAINIKSNSLHFFTAKVSIVFPNL